MMQWCRKSAVLFCLFLAVPVLAQEPSAPDRIRDLERQLEEQRAINEQQQATLEQMQAELNSLKSASTAAPVAATAPATAIAKADAPEEPPAVQQDQPATSSWPSMEISGWVNLDMIYDFDRVAPDYEATLVPTTIPTVPGVYGSDGNFIMSVKQSKLSFVSEADTPLGHARGWIEFDLFGTGSNAGQTTFNLRQAWFEIDRWGAGQTWSTFMDISTWPNVYDWWGPSGMALNRNPMLRYTVPLGDGGSHFAVALEKQNGSFNVGILDELAPGLVEDFRIKTELPDLVARWRIEEDWGHFQLAGVARDLSYENIQFPEFSNSLFGWGFNLTGIFNVFGRDQIKYGLTFGRGIASFMNDGGGSNLVPVATASGLGPEAQKSVGYMLYYDHYWSEKWSSAIGISQNRNDLTNLQITDQHEKVTYASTNLFYTYSPYFVTGVEALYGKLDNADGLSGSDFRIQFTTRYIFANRYNSR